MYGSLHDSPGVVRSGIQAGTVTGLGDEQFRIGPAKVFIDGSSSGPTAATRLPYTSNPNDSGILYLNQEELNQILGEAHEAGWQITAHAIGDKAVEMMINCIGNALNNHPRDDPRHRIEHAAITPPDLVKKIRELGIIPVPNPAFIQEFGDGYIKDYGERVDHMFPIRSFLDANIIPAIGSDSPITSYHPLIGIHAAVNRFSKSEKEVGTSQTITLQEAIKLYTWNAAYASFEEKRKGSLEAGKLADLVILDRLILNTPNHEIQDIEVEMTIINGEVLFEKEVIKHG
jgi:predicted amidohydrolase YtcJ